MIETKWCGEVLDKHGSQLFRYFATTEAKFAILTNGIIYRFYTDLNAQNKMDIQPFLEINMLDIKERCVNELKKFHKDNFDTEAMSNTASELKYLNEINQLMAQQLKSPSDNFIKYVLDEIYPGKRTQNVIDKFKEIIKNSLNQFINELMNDKITAALKTNDEQNKVQVVPNIETELIPKIITTEDELEGYFIVKHLIGEILSKDKITYRDTESYLGVLYDNNNRKWICRIKLDSSSKYILIPDENKNPVKYSIDKIDDIYKYKQELLDVAKRYIKE